MKIKVISLLLLTSANLLWAMAADSLARHDSLHTASLSSVVQDSVKWQAGGKAIRFLTEHDSLRSFAGVIMDSSHIQRSAYGSLGDILSELAGVYVADRGSVGQLSLAALHSADYRHTDVVFDGLLLNDPLTGLADLNLAPVQAVRQAGIMPEPYAYGSEIFSPGFSLKISSRDLAAASLRSAVAYRTGANGYDDIDARLGMKLSKNSTLNLGGILKNYSGTMSAIEKYRAQKINMTMTRHFGPSWQLEYLLLLNKMDRDLPWLDASMPAVNPLHEKQDRYDHGLVLNHRGTRLFWQYTDLHRELYNYYYGVKQIQDAARSRLSFSTHGHLGAVRWQTGALWQYTGLTVTEFSKQHRHDFDLWARLRSSANSAWFWQIGLGAAKQGDLQICLLPELHFRPPLWRGWQSWLWFGSHATTAGLAGDHATESYYYGRRIFHQEQSRMTGMMLEKQWQDSRFFLSASYNTVQTEWAVDSVFVTPLWDERWVVDCSWQQNLGFHFSFFIKQRVGRSIEKLCTWSYLQYRNIFFSGDLDAQLRIGASQIFLDERLSYTGISATQWIPYAHAGFKIKDVYLFFSMQNLLGLNYRLVSGYAMPKQQLRWGFVWNFYD